MTALLAVNIPDTPELETTVLYRVHTIQLGVPVS